MNENITLSLGSLFDGSGSFPFGGILAGIEPKWSSEIEPFPVLVTHKRLPQVKHYGDVSGISGADLEPVDIITFGSPCQDLSIAGKRAGIHEGERSNLFFQAIRIIREMREKTNGQYPRYCVWENVPGAFSSNRGDDFKAVLEAVIGVKEEGIEVPSPANHRWPKADVYLGDGWSVAYRVLDAQYWSVPQRRARIYLVADFAGGSAGEILFKSEGVSGYTPQGFRAWQGAAGGAEESTGETGGRPDDRGGVLCVNTQGNSGVGITEDKSLALVAQDHGNHPAVLQSAGFSTEHSAKSRSIGYEEEMSPTLRAGVVPAAMLFDNHAQEARHDGPMDISPTVTARYGTGGNNQPLVAEPEPITMKIRGGKEGGGKGILCQHDKSATLGCNNDQTIFQPADNPEIKAFGVCSKSSHAMLSDNPHSGFYEAKTSRTLDRSGGNAVSSNQGGICVVAPVLETYDVRFTSEGSRVVRGHVYPTDTARTLSTDKPDPAGNQGGVAVVEKDPAYALQGSMIGREDKNGPQGDGVNEDVSFTLNCTDKHAVAYGIDRAAFNQGENAKFGFTVEEETEPTIVARGPGAVAQPAYSANKASFFTQAVKEKAGTLVATDYKDPPIVNDTANDEPIYIVRRLTPTECARLQGFPDWWCSELAIPEPTDEEIAFWTEVWETWRSATKPDGKPKTEKQIRKWLSDPYTDAAEYKLWGNGCALPCVYFVLSGIAWAAERET